MYTNKESRPSKNIILMEMNTKHLNSMVQNIWMIFMPMYLVHEPYLLIAQQGL